MVPVQAPAVSRSRPTRIRIGIGGWTYAPWRGSFYPAGHPQRRELEYAARRLGSIEINGTYYGSQKPESFARWRDETPDDFVFAVKAPRYATNRRVLAQAGPTIERFFAGGVMELQGKLGPINWQFLPTKAFDPDDFAAFLGLLPRTVDGRALRHALEVRHESFRAPEFVELAKAHGVAIVLAADGPYPQIADPTSDFVYARIMGTRESEALGYPADELDLWARRARAWATGAMPEGLDHVQPMPKADPPRDVFLYVISGHKPRNPAAAIALMERIGA
ncbi:MAG: DUF72 domain-containing protein [Burkholderiaceae bacterium]|nr:DUF72 domain-containing protein [Burkholderiaceae bacterium]